LVDTQKYNELQIKKFVSAWHRCIVEDARCTSLTKHGRGKGVGGREAGPQRPKARELERIGVISAELEKEGGGQYA
jgi:hypothetical protein